MVPAWPVGLMTAPSSNLEVARGKGVARRKRALRRSALHQYTLNTGLFKELHRRPLSRRTSNTLWDLVQRGGGPFAGILSAFACRVEPGIESGGRTFWILRNEEPVLLCVACWDAAHGDEVFGIAERAYYDLLLQECSRVSAPQPQLLFADHAPGIPDRLPWLARVQFPGLRQLGPRESIVLDELERCLAWTLLTRLPLLR
jgi:hypothetical protein